MTILCYSFSLSLNNISRITHLYKDYLLLITDSDYSSIIRAFLSYLTLQNIMTLKSRLGVTQSHRKSYGTIR